jgi:uncharacterized spore protein YtfJ
VEELQGLVKSTVDEIQGVISATSVVGEAKVVGETTIVPLISTGFWFVGGGGVRPVALVIIDKDGTRVESIRGLVSGTIEKIAERVPDMVSAFRGQQQKQG